MTSCRPDVANNQIDQDARDLRVNGDDMDEIIVFLNALNDPDFDTSIPSSVPRGLPVGGEIDWVWVLFLAFAWIQSCMFLKLKQKNT